MNSGSASDSESKAQLMWLFFDAARSGDVETLERCLTTAGIDVNERDTREQREVSN